jgi:hypothetical protein
MSRNKKNILFSLTLTTPLVLYFLGYLFNHSPELIPTGFIQYDNVSYIAYAQEYLDADRFSLFYKNPYNAAENASPVYFQVHTLLFALLLKAGIGPGFLLIPFTLLCAFFCFRLLIGIYDHLFPEGSYRTISIWLFAWGGGLLMLTGTVLQVMLGKTAIPSITHIDPAAGWWGLNWGRSLLFSCEAWYHLLFLSVVYCILKKKYGFALFASFILSASHPFTGIELLSILCTWLIAEKIIFKNKEIPRWFAAGEWLLLVLHIWFYLFYLNNFEDHRSVSGQYALNWRLRFFNMLPAYCLVGGLAAVRIFFLKGWNDFRSNSTQRLWLCWFLCAFALANHELFMKPMQPLHFTRGYIWTALFLLGLPALHALLNSWRRSGSRKVLALGLLLLFFSDNGIWFLDQIRSRANDVSTQYISRDEQEVFSHIRKHSTNKTVLVTADPVLSYMSSVYSTARTWYSHPFTTPFAARQASALSDFVQHGKIDSAWKNRDLLIIFRKSVPEEVARAGQLPLSVKLTVNTKKYIIMKAFTGTASTK